MRILILGNSYPQRAFLNYFEQNKDNTVFSSTDNYNNLVNFSDFNDIIEFCKANEINMVIPINQEYISAELEEKLNNLNITYFTPNEEACEICKYKSLAKKFSYKSKIQIPKFFIAEKQQTAIDYIKTINFPVAIHPDTQSYIECTKFAETFGQAQKLINGFFENGNRKIIIEDYIEGKNIIFWALSDGYSAKVIGTVAKYQDEVAYFEPEFLTHEIKQNAYQKIIEPTILNLSLEGTEYVGIIGFNTILSHDNSLYLLGYKNFFDDLSVDFFLNGYDYDWINIFENCIKGDVFVKNKSIEPKNTYMLALRQNEDIEFVQAKTKSNLEKYIQELCIETEEYKEAKKLWKY